MEKTKVLAIIHSIITVAVIAFALVIFFNNDFASKIMSQILKILKVEEMEYHVVYIKLFALSCLVCTPCLLYTIFNSDCYEGVCFISVGLLVGFYFMTRSLFSQIPVSKGGELILFGHSTCYGGLVDFLNNLFNIYMWYALPVIYVIVLTAAKAFIDKKIFEEVKNFIFFIVISSVFICVLPILLILVKNVVGIIATTIVTILIIAVLIFGCKTVYDVESSTPKERYILDNGRTVVQVSGDLFRDEYGTYYRKKGDEFIED